MATKIKKTIEELKSSLDGFYGTEGYLRWSPLFRNFLLTDGAKFLADEAEAYWLMDAIASHLPNFRAKADGFAVAILTVKGSKAVLDIQDGNYNSIVKQNIEYTDFPEGEIKLFVEDSGDAWVILLPGEH
jgi:hypothetical protein